MSEVKRISVFIHGPNKKIDMVEAAQLDRVTAERDALQQRLTSADERADVLEGLLREVVALDPRGGFLGWQLDGRVDAALKPAEGSGDD